MYSPLTESFFRTGRRVRHASIDGLERLHRIGQVAGLAMPGHRLGSNWAGRRGLWIVGLLLLLFAPFYLIPPMFLALPPTGFQQQLVAEDAARLRPMLFDAGGHFVMGLGDGTVASSFFVEHPHPAYLGCLQKREDSYRGHPWLNPYGNDIRGAARSVYNLVASSGGTKAGGSTVTGMLQQQLGHQKEGSFAPWRKFAEFYWRTPQMNAVIARGPDHAYEQLAARHLTHLQGTGGTGTTWGIQAAAQTAFGIDQARMSKAQAFMLASAVLNNFSFRYGAEVGRFNAASTIDFMNDPRLRMRDADECVRLAEGRYKGLGVFRKAVRYRCTYNRMLRRAEACAADPVLVPDAAERKAIWTELEDRRIRPNGPGTLPVPKADPLVERLGAQAFAGFGDHLWDVRKRNSFARGESLFGNTARAATVEVQDAFGPAWNHKVAKVTTSIGLVDERRFAPIYRNELRSFLADLDRRGQLNPLYHDWATYKPGMAEPEIRPDAVLAVADAQARIVRYHAAGERPVYGHGDFPCPAGSPATCRYNHRQEAMQVASIGKVVGAMVIARTGQADMKVHGIPVGHVLAVSDSEAFATALERADPLGRAGAAMIEGLHWHDASRKPAGGPDRMSRTLSFGTAAAAPRTVHHLAHGLTELFAGRAGPVPAPTFIRSATFLDLEKGHESDPLSRLPDVYGLQGRSLETASLDEVKSEIANPAAQIDVGQLVTPARIDDLRRLLQGPVCDPNGGTLRLLVEWCNPSRARFIWGKTGTLDVSDAYAREMHIERRPGVVRAIWIIGGVQFHDGRTYSFVLFVGGSSLRAPLTIGTPDHEKDLEAWRAASLIRTTLRELETHSSQGGR